MINLSRATDVLEKRGPDSRGIFNDHFVGLGHRRLAIIDTTDDGRQPMKDPSGRFTIIFNGEIFNYKELRDELINGGVEFQSQTDTEVLLHLFIHKKEKCLDCLNGFFAFAIYDAAEETLFIARDRIGIKPLLYYQDEDKFIFASELKSLLAYGIPKELDLISLYQYLQLNYIPAPATILKKVKKLMSGHYMQVKKKEFNIKSYYQIPYRPDQYTSLNYEEQQQKLFSLLDQSVQKRMVADVPLGTFLSGGLDSSVISALAARHTDHLHTFSIGFKDEPFFDETPYARLVAKHLNTDHTIYSLTNDDLFAHLYEILNYIDEPFADSSAIPVHILSKNTRQKVTVALSGDGADELFAGYNKHAAAFRASQNGFSGKVVESLLPVWKKLPKSRNNAFSNKVRQLQKFAEGLKLSESERYWQWATLSSENEGLNLICENLKEEHYQAEYNQRKEQILGQLKNGGDFNDILYTDMHLVLVNDMLTKVDLMSMSCGLEIRVPFLDHNVVDFAFSLPASSKINNNIRKRIVQDTFRHLLPPQLYNRPKKGFEVPLLKWLRQELRLLIDKDLLADDFIEDQGIFELEEIKKTKRKLFSSSPGDTHAHIWALVVFQYWWKKYFS